MRHPFVEDQYACGEGGEGAGGMQINLAAGWRKLIRGDGQQSNELKAAIRAVNSGTADPLDSLGTKLAAAYVVFTTALGFFGLKEAELDRVVHNARLEAFMFMALIALGLLCGLLVSHSPNTTLRVGLVVFTSGAL